MANLRLHKAVEDGYTACLRWTPPLYQTKEWRFVNCLNCLAKKPSSDALDYAMTEARVKGVLW